jgi:N-acetylmuramic acid 6-phosphate etherase
MVNMQLANDKLVNRGVQMVMQATGLTNAGEAKSLLLEEGSVRKAVEKFRGRLV